MSYDDLVEDLVSAEKDILGTQAISIAQGVDGLEMDDSGTVIALHRDGQAIAEDLCSAYVDDLGGAATITLSSVADRYADELTLPATLA